MTLGCLSIMCKHKIKNRKDAREFLVRNHPDKNSDFPKDEFTSVLSCYKDKNFCYTKGKTKTPKYKASSIKATKKARDKMFTCMRKTANFSSIYGIYKFDDAAFNKKVLNEEMVKTSPKMIQLLNNIKLIDAEDQRNHGKKFKHFIFSDVKEGGYGAKIIASALAANGFNHVIKARKKSKKLLQLYWWCVCVCTRPPKLAQYSWAWRQSLQQHMSRSRGTAALSLNTMLALPQPQDTVTIVVNVSQVILMNRFSFMTVRPPSQIEGNSRRQLYDRTVSLDVAVCARLRNAGNRLAICTAAGK